MNFFYHGKEMPGPHEVKLKAGPLSMVFVEGGLRYVRLDDKEIVRRVYVAIRDRNWDTAPNHLSNLRIDTLQNSFTITYEAENKQKDIDFHWRGRIVGHECGTIEFMMDGEARSAFQRNRIGFCVLHPIRECAGQPCRVEKVDSTMVESTFPYNISAHQLFTNVRAIMHEVHPGIWAEVRFAGDVFETEDQRNWTDASYKTYSTPLDLPFPVEVKAKTKISQSVTLTLKGAVPTELTSLEESVFFSIDEGFRAPLPRIGIGVASHGKQLTEREVTRLKALNLCYLRADLSLFRPDYASALERATNESNALGVPLEIALTVSDSAEEELRSLIAALNVEKPNVCQWLVFHVKEKSTGERWIKLARKNLIVYCRAAKIGSGTNAYFAEINRHRPPVEVLDLVCYSMNPQVHASDEASMVESLAAQAATVQSARQFAGDRPVAVTPVTLKPRFNPNATAPEPETLAGQLPPQVDVRQISLFGAAWTAGSVKYLAEAGSFSITYYETTGWRGVMETETGPPLPGRLHSLPGCVFPLYHVLADVGEFAGGHVIPSTSSVPLKVASLILQKDGRARAIVANLSPDSQNVRLMGAWLGPRVRVKYLDETSAGKANNFPEVYRSETCPIVEVAKNGLVLELKPYAIARIDSD